MKNLSEMKKIQGQVAETAEELRDLMLRTIAEIEAGHIKPELAKEMFNGFGKVLKSAALQLEMADINKVRAKCKFVENAG